MKTAIAERQGPAAEGLKVAIVERQSRTAAKSTAVKSAAMKSAVESAAVKSTAVAAAVRDQHSFCIGRRFSLDSDQWQHIVLKFVDATGARQEHRVRRAGGRYKGQRADNAGGGRNEGGPHLLPSCDGRFLPSPNILIRPTGAGQHRLDEKMIARHPAAAEGGPPCDAE
jgi:hypothetical protein